MANLHRTPLYDFHVRQGGRIVPFAGWELPVQYTGILDEHRAVRERAGLFDVSHMGEVEVEGPGAREFLQYVLTNDVNRLSLNKAIYGLLCYEDGGCVDDVIVYQRGEQAYLVCVNAANVEKDVLWLKEHARDFDCKVRNASANYAQLALQGPAAKEILDATGTDSDLATLRRFMGVDATVAGVKVILSTTGYTGEAGYEIYCRPEDADALATAIVDAGKPLGLALCGLGSRDSLRLEAGLPLYGHEISENITPLQAGLGWAVKLNKGADFVGREELQKEADEGATRRLVHFILDDRRIARSDAVVLWDERPVGVVTSGTFSPMIGKPIGAALIDTNAPDDELVVDLRGTKIPLQVRKAPLHR